LCVDGGDLCLALLKFSVGRKQIVDGRHEIIVAVATSASRDAKNSDALVGKLHDLGVELSVIEGEREAALSFRGASRGYEGENLLVADIGGGSTEVVLGVGGEVGAFVQRWMPPYDGALLCFRSSG